MAKTIEITMEISMLIFKSIFKIERIIIERVGVIRRRLKLKISLIISMLSLSTLASIPKLKT